MSFIDVFRLDMLPECHLICQHPLERLHRKGLVGRERQGRAYHYRAKLTRADIIRRTLHDLTRDVARGDLVPSIHPLAGHTLFRIDLAGCWVGCCVGLPVSAIRANVHPATLP